MEPVEFGDYILLKKLATGGMGEIFLARPSKSTGLERHVAIKRILPDLSGDDEFVKMFLEEARLAAQLNHHNIVEIYDLGICGDQYFIAMEFLEGRDLRRIMSRLQQRQKALPGAHAIQVIHGAAEGLRYAHELTDAFGQPRNIIHRDVSPQNIFVTFDGSIKLLDFGIAKAEARSIRTRTGGLKGKYPYMSPEQVRGERVDRRSDIFSLGVVLWEITVGKRLFRRDNDLLTLNAVLKCEVPTPQQVMDGYPPDLGRIVMTALAKDPEARYSSCRALQEDLEQFLAQTGLVLSPRKFGKSVQHLFSDEPTTIRTILEKLKEKPRTKSLLHDDGPADGFGDSRGGAGPAPADEGSEVSPPSVPFGRGAIPTAGFAVKETESSSDSASVPSTSGVVNVRWTAESMSDAPLDNIDNLSIDIDIDDNAVEEVVSISKVVGGDSKSTTYPAGAGPPKAGGSDGRVSAPPTKPAGVPAALRGSGHHDSPAPGARGGSTPAPSVYDVPTGLLPVGHPSRSPRSTPSQPLSPVTPPRAPMPTPVDPLDVHPPPQRRLIPTPVDPLDVHPPPPRAPMPTPVDPLDVHPPPQRRLIPTPVEPMLAQHPVDEDSLETTHSQSITIPRPRRGEVDNVWRWALAVAVLAAVVVLGVVAGILFLVWSSPSPSAPEGGGQPVGAESVTSAGAAATELPANTLSFEPPDPSSPPPSEAPSPAPDDGASREPSPTPSDEGAAEAPRPPAPERPRPEKAPDRDRDERPAVKAPERSEPRDRDEPATVSVSLSSSPSGLTAFVAGRRIGTTPTRATLRPGTHRVRLLSGSEGIDYRTKMVVPAGSSHRETITVSKGTLAFRVRPYALVFVDGKRVGLTPMPPVSVYAGRHRVRLVNDSLGKTLNKTVTVRSGGRATVDVDMTAGD